jgi:hypothetical protein
MIEYHSYPGKYQKVWIPQTITFAWERMHHLYCKNNVYANI